MADNESDIAIIGMAVRVPGARNIHELWRNLRDGVESVTFFDDAELLAAGESAERLRKSNYVRSAAVLDDMEMFDAELFGFSPKEAAIMDPQHRHFIECAYEALEAAGHPPDRFDGSVGVFGGCGMGGYFYFNICSNPALVDSVGMFLLRHTGNDKDFLATRVSYLLNLTGPSVNVQTACSTSLVATHVACQSLLSFECDLALAGGVTIELPHRRGYLFQENEILSPDGHCRPFDHRSEGTIFGSGVGIVALRRLGDAIADGDHIHAVIKGSAINNDGASKVGYLAPSVDGQAAAMNEAYEVAGVHPESIAYVECHGTGTRMGDPIEIEALTQAFRRSTDRVGFCRIGSIKSNIGHLDTAAGVVSLIKAVLAVEHAAMPPSLNFEKPNPAIEIERTPFVVNDSLTPWSDDAGPRRAAVNSLGVGGTNAHVIVEQAPSRPAATDSPRPHHLLCWSAKNKKSLDVYATKLADWLREHPEQPLADVAYSLFEGRVLHEHRRVLAARCHEEAIALIDGQDRQRIFTHSGGSRAVSVVFMFPGGGSQYVGMGAGLYATEPVFKADVDRGLEQLAKLRPDLDLKSLLVGEPSADDSRFEQTKLQIPAIFIVEHALATLLMSWGVKPDAMIGHSLGQYCAACLAGVMSYEDALALVVLRGDLLDRASGGAMLSVQLPREDVEALLGDDLDLAIVNGPQLCVVSGPSGAIDRLQRSLEQRDIDAQRLRISTAAHSRMLEPVLEEFAAFLRETALSAPSIPIVSNGSGTWMTAEEATSPEYWSQHLRRTVMFAAGMQTLLAEPGRAFIEVGPGRALSSLTRQQDGFTPGLCAVSSLRHADEAIADEAYFTTLLGRLWAADVEVDIARVFERAGRQRVVLPTYAFAHRPYFIEPGVTEAPVVAPEAPERIDDTRRWFFAPKWRPTPVALGSPKGPRTWLVFVDEAGVCSALADRLVARGDKVIRVFEGDAFSKRSDAEYLLTPERGREGYDALIRDLVKSGATPNRILHGWMLTTQENFRPGSSFFHRNLERGFYSLFFLGQAIASEGLPGLHITALSNGMQSVDGEPVSYPEKATLLGPIKVMPRELPSVTCSSVDVQLVHAKDSMSRLLARPARLLKALRHLDDGLDAVIDDIEAELSSEPNNAIVALRGGRRLQQVFEHVVAEPRRAAKIKPRGAYLITGGLGDLGLVAARKLASSAEDVRLVLVGRSAPSAAQSAEVAALEQLGATVVVESADVTDVSAMRAIVESMVARFGAIDGVIHAAGVVDDGLIAMKTMADVEGVFAPKVHGTVVLDEILRGRPLDFFVLYASTSTIIAPAGQVDYVAANDYLNAYATGRDDAVAINWGVWRNVGMAARAMAPGADADAASEEACDHPLLDRRVRSELFARFGVASHWILDEHRTIAGHAVLPGTAYVELATAGLRALGETSAFEIDDLFFVRPLHVADAETTDVRVRFKRTERGYGFETHSRCMVEGEQGWQLHAQAQLRLLPMDPPDRLDIAAIEARCDRYVFDDPAGLRSRQEDHLRFGPRWRVLHRSAYGAGEAIGRLSLPALYRGDVGPYHLHPALLDIATGFAMELIDGYADSFKLWVPVSYGRVRVHGDLPASVVSWVSNSGNNRADNEFASFDVTIADEDGRVLVEVSALQLKRMSGEVDFAVAPELTAGEVEIDGADRKSLSPGELILQSNLRHGIQADEGAEALVTLASGQVGHNVVVSSMEVDVLRKQIDAASASIAASDVRRRLSDLRVVRRADHRAMRGVDPQRDRRRHRATGCPSSLHASRPPHSRLPVGMKASD